MAVTQNSYVGNGSTTTYSFTFPYLKTADIKASINATVTTAFTLPSATTLQFNTAPASGDKIKIYRETDSDALTATFYAGSAIKSEDLNDNFTQNLYGTQEVTARYLSNLGGTMVGDLTLAEDVEIIFEGATDDAHETKLTVADPTADRTITLPNETGTVLTSGGTGTVTSAMIADGTIVNADISNTTITGSKLVNDTITSTQIAADAVGASELSDNSVASTNIIDGSIVDADINASAAIAQSKIALDAELTELATMPSTTASALADLTQAEVQILDGATLSTTELNYVDGVTSGIQAQIDGKQASGSYQTADSDLDELSAMQAGAAAKLKLLTADEVEKIDGLTASTTELNKLDGVTASATNLNIVDGMTKQTTISDQDTSYPTSGAVVDYVASALQPFGGFEAVADEDNFPTTQPASGVVISINDAGGIVINGSGVSTTARTAGNGSDNVTINGFPSSLYSETLAAGVGLQVSSTGSSNTYTYHKILASETDVKQLSDDINDFNSRFRIASSAPGSANDEGDLYFDTGTNKMYVYDGSSWGEVTSTGDFKYLFLSEVGNTSAASYDGSKVSFDLHEGSVSGSLASISSAAQLMVSINGVVQKPNTGTNTSGLDGFVMTDGHTIKFTAGVPSSASVFVIQSGSALAINAPGDGTVTNAKIADDTIAEVKLDIHNAPSGTDKYLKYTSNGMEWATVSQYTTPLTTRGDIIFRDASGDQRLAKGTAGQYLKIGANDPEWADVVGAVADGCIFENDQTISNNYTIAAGKGAHSVGPITVNATVTVNGNWVVS